MTDSTRIAHLHAVVLAGGSGTRFWPLSREMSPKQFVSIFGGVSLITRAVRRIARAIEPGALHVLTNERLVGELRNHLSAQEELAGLRIDYLAEPTPRNTGPAVALAAAYLVEIDPDAILVVLPSDHLLADGEAWDTTLAVAVGLAEEGRLVTLGLEPRYPETGYGYIRRGTPIAGHSTGGVAGCEVQEFIEKPDLETAERFIAEGGYLWNSGMLVARADVVLRELERAGEAAATPDSASGRDIVQAARAVAATPASAWTIAPVRERFAALPAVPFDKAALEVSDVVAVVPTDLEWSDVGSLLAIGNLAEPDEHGNVLVGRITDVDSEGIIGYAPERLVATLGLHDVMVVDTADATLVAAKERAQDVRLVVEALRAAGAPEIVESRHSLRPWGSWTLLVKGPGFQVKTIEVLPGKRLSLQSHAERSEHWVVVEGRARVEIDGVVRELEANESAYVPIGARHRLENSGDLPLKVVEVAVGSYLGEDDIERYQDDWAR